MTPLPLRSYRLSEPAAFEWPGRIVLPADGEQAVVALHD